MKKPKKTAKKIARGRASPPAKKTPRARSPQPAAADKAGTARRALISKPGIYPGMSADAYHADPCAEPSVSASLLALIDASSPAHAVLTHPRLNPAFRERPPTKEMEFGTAAHSAIVGGPPIYVVKAKDWRTDVAKTERDRIRHAGHIPVLAADVPRLKGMKDKLSAELPKVPGLSDIFAAKGESECTAVWREDGIYCRARADRWFPPGAMRDFRDGLIVDYKTTGEFNAAPESWSRTVFNIGGDFQSTWYPEGFAMALRLPKRPAFLYVVQETEPPFEFQAFAPDEILREHTTSKIVRAFAGWKAAYQAKSFAGYARAVAYLTPPAWELKREERAAIAAQVMYRP